NGSACGGRIAPRLRQDPANSKRFCRPCNAIGGWFGTRQKPLRSIDRGPCRVDLFAQLRNLPAGGLDQCPRPGHEVAMLGVHRTCSRGFKRGHEPPFVKHRQPRHAPTRASTTESVRLNTTDETGILFRLWPRTSKAIALAGGIDLPADRTHRPLSAAFSTVSSIRNAARRP